MKFKEFILSMLSDAEDGGISSKRVIATISFIAYLVLTFINTYTAYKTPSIFSDGLMYIILGGFFTGTLEYFSKRQTSTTVKTGDNADITVNPAPAKPPVVTKPTDTKKQAFVTEHPEVNEDIVDVEIKNNNIEE